MEFSHPQLRRGYFTCTGLLALDGEEWLVEMEMIEPYRADMLGFFEEIADEAEAGWDGVKSWKSEFAELRVDATNDGRGVTVLHAFIRSTRPIGEEDEQSGVLVVANRALVRVADEMRRFLRLPHGHRFEGVE